VNVPKTFVNYDAGTTFSPQGLFENSVMDRAARVQQLSLATTYNGGEVNVPKTVVNYEAGTTFSPQGLFENSVMDRAARIQQLSNGDAHDDREQVDLDAPHETKYIGTIAVDETVDGMARPMGDVKHLDCYGRDDDPDCQTSAAPLFDKAQATSELSTKASDDDLAAYFAQQQKQAERARKPITPKMQGAKKLADSKGTKFGLSAKAARQQANAIFGGAAHKQMKQQKTQLKLDTRAADKQVDAIFTDISKGTHGANNGALIDDNMAIQRKYGGEEKLITDDMKSVNTQQLRINHGKASKIPAHLTTFPTQPAVADVGNFFDDLNAGPHGANNGALYDAQKHPKNQFKVAQGQQLAKRHLHHGYSAQMADSDLNNWYGSMHASNNHHLQDKHADMYSDPHTAFLKGHEAAAPKKHGVRKASAMQMLRSNRDDAFLGDASPVTKPGNLVKFAGASATGDMAKFYDGLKKSRYGANNGHLKDGTAQPNRARGQYHGETTAKALGDINGYFSSMSANMAAHSKPTAPAAGKGMATDAATSDINGYFQAMTPKVKHVAAKLDPKLDASTASQDINGFFNSIAKGKHGVNNGNLHAKNSHAKHAAKGHGNKKITTQESRDKINTFYGGNALATAPAQQPNKQPASESIGDIVTDAELDTPMFQGFKHKTGLEHPEGHQVDDKIVDPTSADCGDNKDCTTSRSPLLYKGKKEDGSLKASGSDAMSAAKADKDISTFFNKEGKEVKTEASVEEKRASKIGLSSKAARQDAKAYFIKEQKLSEYGVGPEEDHKIVINQAMGVDAMMPESMFEANPEPSGDQIDEINEAIQAQRNEGYTNGDGMPADDVEVP